MGGSVGATTAAHNGWGKLRGGIFSHPSCHSCYYCYCIPSFDGHVIVVGEGSEGEGAEKLLRCR